MGRAIDDWTSGVGMMNCSKNEGIVICSLSKSAGVKVFAVFVD